MNRQFGPESELNQLHKEIASASHLHKVLIRLHNDETIKADSVLNAVSL